MFVQFHLINTILNKYFIYFKCCFWKPICKFLFWNKFGDHQYLFRYLYVSRMYGFRPILDILLSLLKTLTNIDIRLLFPTSGLTLLQLQRKCYSFIRRMWGNKLWNNETNWNAYEYAIVYIFISEHFKTLPVIHNPFILKPW